MGRRSIVEYKDMAVSSDRVQVLGLTPDFVKTQDLTQLCALLLEQSCAVLRTSLRAEGSTTQLHHGFIDFLHGFQQPDLYDENVLPEDSLTFLNSIHQTIINPNQAPSLIPEEEQAIPGDVTMPTVRYNLN